MATELAIRNLDFEAAVRVAAAAELQLTGSAKGSVVSELGTLVRTLHDRLVADHVRALTVDVRGLELINPTCFNVLVNWLDMITELPREQRYQLRFLTNVEIRWQRRSLHTLSCFATDLVTVED